MEDVNLGKMVQGATVRDLTSHQYTREMNKEMKMVLQPVIPVSYYHRDHNQNSFLMRMSTRVLQHRGRMSYLKRVILHERKFGRGIMQALAQHHQQLRVNRRRIPRLVSLLFALI